MYIYLCVCVCVYTDILIRADQMITVRYVYICFNICVYIYIK
jgi:hypothetical protein